MSQSAMSQPSMPAPSSQSSLGALIPSQGWIIGPKQDFVLFLGTPLLLVSVFAAARHFWSLTAFTVFATVLAMGHYLPGLMRAYGDPALFNRFRTRFLVAPIILISMSLYMNQRESSHAFMLLVVLWGAWHWLMQTYGLVRIYDAKAKNFDSTSARLDYALCIAWFGVLYWRTDGAATVLMRFYKAGGLLSPEYVQMGVKLWFIATLGISALYIVHLVRRTMAGSPPSLLKLALLGVSFAFYLYAFGYSSSYLVAYALFEGYHDIQYLAIVWVFNCNRAAKDPGAGSFTRFLFRQRTPLVILYVLLCVGFGSYDYVVKNFVTEEKIAQLGLGLIAGLALVHFYFDGFIWRIRESDTRATLNVDTGSETKARRKLSPSLRHVLLWVAIGAPLLALGYFESAGKGVDDVTAFQKLLVARPNSYKSNMMFATKLRNMEREDEALGYAQRARELRPGFDQCEILYADLLMANVDDLTDEQLDEVIACYESAAVTRPDLVPLQLNWGNALRLKGRTAEAANRFQAAMDADPNNADTFFHLAKLLMSQQKFNEAALACTEAVRVNPDHGPSHGILGQLMMQSRPSEAFKHFRHAIRIDPSQVRPMSYLAIGLATVGDGTLRNPAEALELATQATKLDASSADAWNALAVANAALSEFKDAIVAGEKAQELCRAEGEQAAADQIGANIIRYRNGQP